MSDSISENEVKDILRNRKQKIKNIHEKLIRMYEESNLDLLPEIALPAFKFDGMPGQKGGNRDLGDVLETYQKRQYARNMEIRETMWALSDQEDRINRVWACFCVLDDPYYTILDSLYVKNGLYETVEKDSDMSHKTFEKYRKEGIHLLVQFYESDESAVELMKNHYLKQNPSHKQKRMAPADGNYEQMSIEEWGVRPDGKNAL